MKVKLFDSLMKQDGEFRHLMESLKHMAVAHPFFKRYAEIGVKEGLFSDMIGALGRMHNVKKG